MVGHGGIFPVTRRKKTERHRTCRAAWLQTTEAGLTLMDYLIAIALLFVVAICFDRWWRK
jgi:hypothetical protein